MVRIALIARRFLYTACSVTISVRTFSMYRIMEQSSDHSFHARKQRFARTMDVGDPFVLRHQR